MKQEKKDIGSFRFEEVEGRDDIDWRESISRQNRFMNGCM